MAIEGKVAVSGRSLAKDFHRLMRSIDALSGGQARLVGWDETDLKKGITLAITPDSGLYKDGEFVFLIKCNSRYPDNAPDVYCKTLVYHPNIDIEGDGEICLNLLDDDFWSASMTLEDVAQGVLFLMHNPNLDDPLCVVFSPGMDGDQFADNVRQSLDGGLVEGYQFMRNRVGRAERDIAMEEEADGALKGEIACSRKEKVGYCDHAQPVKADMRETGAAPEGKSAEERRKMAIGGKEEEGR